jgi:hypothetical protein
MVRAMSALLLVLGALFFTVVLGMIVVRLGRKLGGNYDWHRIGEDFSTRTPKDKKTGRFSLPVFYVPRI